MCIRDSIFENFKSQPFQTRSQHLLTLPYSLYVTVWSEDCFREIHNHRYEGNFSLVNGEVRLELRRLRGYYRKLHTKTVPKQVLSFSNSVGTVFYASLKSGLFSVNSTPTAQNLLYFPLIIWTLRCSKTARSKSDFGRGPAECNGGRRL